MNIFILTINSKYDRMNFFIIWYTYEHIYIYNIYTFKSQPIAFSSKEKQ